MTIKKKLVTKEIIKNKAVKDMSCDIVENPSLEQINEGLKKIDAIMVLPSIESNEIYKIINFYNEYEDFDIIYIHKYTEGEEETIFGMKRGF